MRHKELKTLTKNININKFNYFLFCDLDINTCRHADRQVEMPSAQQTWYADLLKFTVTSNENVLTSHWTNKVAFGPFLHSVNPHASLTAKLSAGKQAGDIHWSQTVISLLSCH